MRGKLEAEQNCNILTPTLMAITVFLSRSPGLLNRGLGAQPLWDMFLIPASSLQLQLLNWGLEGPLCWVLVFSTASYLQLHWSPTALRLYNCSTPTFFLWASQIALIQPVHGQGYILIFPDQMHLLFTQVHFLFWQLGQGQYVTQHVSHYFTRTHPSFLTIQRKVNLKFLNVWVLIISFKMEHFFKYLQLRNLRVKSPSFVL